MTEHRDPAESDMSEPAADLTPIGFDGVVGYLTERADRARQDLVDYYTTYTGRFFEQFSALGDPDAFDANDLAACASLSTPIDGKTLNALWSRIDDLNAALAACPDREVTLADVDPTSDEYTAMEGLYKTIRSMDGMGKVRTSKLLASKRPALIPIRDRLVEAILGAGSDWWAPWRELVLDPRIPTLVEDITPSEARACDATLLRRLDVILWKEAERRTNTTEQR